MRLRILTFLLAVCAFPLAKAQQPLSVEIERLSGEQARALDPIEFTLKISASAGGAGLGARPASRKNDNASADRGTAETSVTSLMVTSVKVLPAGTLTNAYKQNATCIFQERGMRAGQSVGVHCILYPRDNNIAKRLVPGLEPIFARSMILQAEVCYIQLDKADCASNTTRIAVIPPLVAVFYGGMTGALMLALFRGLAPLLRSVPTQATTPPLFGRELVESIYHKLGLALRLVLVMIAWLILGGVCAIMVIILTKASTGDLSPVKIVINDFLGGVLVGLLSFPVVTWLRKRLISLDAENLDSQQDSKT